MRIVLKKLLCSPVFITVLAFAVRVLLLFHGSGDIPVAVKANQPFGYELGRVARAIAAGQGFSSPLRLFDTGPTAWFTPIYPYLVAGIFKVWGIYSDLSHIIISMLNSAFVALTIIPIYSIAKRTFGQGVAVASSWIWAFLPTAMFFPIAWVWDTTLAALFLTLIFWATLAMRENQTLSAWAGYGALWAIGVLINPSILSLLPFLLGWLLWQSHKARVPWVKFAASTLLVFAIALGPWTIRNYGVFGKFIVLRSNFGLELWLGNNPSVPDTWSPWLHPNDNFQEGEKYKRMGEIAYMAEKQKEAITFMRTHPADTLYFTFRRFVNNWLGVTDSPVDSWSHSPYNVKAFVVLNCLFPLFTLLGALFAYREKQREAVPFAMVLLVFPAIFYVTHTSPRYRFPMDPIMVVLAAHGVTSAISLLRTRSAREREAATPVASVTAL
jgi:4-amino-4-deoxy-L-arabinose transferase-like glycosyltransferase